MTYPETAGSLWSLVNAETQNSYTDLLRAPTKPASDASVWDRLGATVDAFGFLSEKLRTWQDSDLTAEALLRQRRERFDAVRAAAIHDIAEVQAEIETVAEKAAAVAAPLRPVFHPDDVAELTRSADAWQFGILPQLNGGRHWGEVIESISSLDEAVAIERFAGPYVRSTNKPREAEQILADIAAGVHARHADLAPSSEARATILAANDAAALVNAVDSVALAVQQATPYLGSLNHAKILIKTFSHADRLLPAS